MNHHHHTSREEKKLNSKRLDLTWRTIKRAISECNLILHSLGESSERGQLTEEYTVRRLADDVVEVRYNTRYARFGKRSGSFLLRMNEAHKTIEDNLDQLKGMVMPTHTS